MLPTCTKLSHTLSSGGWPWGAILSHSAGHCYRALMLALHYLASAHCSFTNCGRRSGGSQHLRCQPADADVLSLGYFNKQVVPL